MPKVLSEAQIAAYGRNGILFPLPALAAAEYGDCRARLDAFYVQPVCSPTRAAFLTGRLVYSHAIADIRTQSRRCWRSGRWNHCGSRVDTLVSVQKRRLYIERVDAGCTDEASCGRRQAEEAADGGRGAAAGAQLQHLPQQGEHRHHRGVTA